MLISSIQLNQLTCDLRENLTEFLSQTDNILNTNVNRAPIWSAY